MAGFQFPCRLPGGGQEGRPVGLRAAAGAELQARLRCPAGLAWSAGEAWARGTRLQTVVSGYRFRVSQSTGNWLF